jgi:transcriptional regulator with XRE-family HTH domain
MTNPLDPTSELVNNDAAPRVDSVSRSLYLLGMATIADRVREILSRKDWSQSELSRRAGLTRSHIGWILGHPDSPVQSDTLAKIAEGAGVSTHWLTTGQGTPDSDDAGSPSVTRAVLGHVPIYANAEGWDDAVAVFTATEEGARTPRSVLHDAGQRAPYNLHGPVTMERVRALVHLVIAESDPVDLRRQLDEANRKLAEALAAQPAEAAEFERRVREAAAKKAKKGGRG